MHDSGEKLLGRNIVVFFYFYSPKNGIIVISDWNLRIKEYFISIHFNSHYDSYYPTPVGF